MKRPKWLLVGAAAFLLLSPASMLARIYSPAEANRELAVAQTYAVELENATDHLQAISRMPLEFDTRTHAARLNEIRNDVNKLGAIVAELHESRANLAPWQADLTSRLLPEIQPLTNDIEHLIQFLNDTPERRFQAQYTDRVEEAYDQATSIVKSIDTYRDWADSQRTWQDAQHQLDQLTRPQS